MRCCCEVISGALASTVTASFCNRESVHFQFQKPVFKLNTFSSLSLTRRKLLVVPTAPPATSAKKLNGLCRRSGFTCGCSTSAQCSDTEPSSNDFVVVNFYHFVFIKDPEAEVTKHLCFLEGLDINGRVYLNEQGINAQISPSENGHAFPKLKLRYKPSLVQFEGGISHLPLLDPSMRATPLAPSEWKNRLEAINRTDLSSEEYTNTNYILLDVRNGYEWDIGHFHGAQRPNVDCFRSTSFGLSQEEATASDPLSNVDKEKANILMYCTGGIRCDVYSTILRQRGFQNLYTLKGGVSHYLKNEGPAEWVGNLFVFDSRLSLPPSVYYPQATAEVERTQVAGDDKFAKCYICDLEVSELRHRNCANLDCNLLFLCCRECVKDLRGCCCRNCTTAPRLRPVLNGDQRYKKWHIYRDVDLQGIMKTST